MIGLSLTNTGPAVVPTYGRRAMLGTNPISLAAPANRECPFVLVMATSTVIARFRDLDAFKADMDDLLRALKDSPKVEGQDRIYVAGEPEWECEQRRRREGIPLAPGLVSQLREVSVEAGVSFTLGA